MPLHRNSKIRELCRTPLGFDAVQSLLVQHGRSVKWAENFLTAGLPVSTLDRFGGPGFADALLDIVNAFDPVLPTPAPPEPQRAWWKEAVIYEIYPPSFMDSDHDGVGDLGGVAQRLPYLASLGVDVLWLRPMAGGAGETDYTALPEEMGTPEDFEALAEAAHSRGMRVVVGLELAADSAQGLESALEFWHRRGADGFCLAGLGSLCRTKPEEQATVDALALRGLEPAACGPRLHRSLRELRALAPTAGLFIGGELRRVGTQVARLFTAPERHELDMLFDTGHLLPRLRGEETGGDLRFLKQYFLRWMQQYGGEGWMPLLLETADTPRMVSRLGASPIYRSILAKQLGTLLLTLRGTPVVYQGQELGLPNIRLRTAADLQDTAAQELYATLRERMGDAAALEAAGQTANDHARAPMPWSAGLHGGFTGATPWARLPDGVEYLNAAAQMEDPASVWRHYQKLIALRKKHPAMLYGSFNPVFVKNKKVFCYFRILEGEKWYVEMNLTEKETPRPGRILRTMKLVLSNYEAQGRALRPYEANLYRCE